MVNDVAREMGGGLESGSLRDGCSWLFDRYGATGRAALDRKGLQRMLRAEIVVGGSEIDWGRIIVGHLGSLASWCGTFAG